MDDWFWSLDDLFSLIVPIAAFYFLALPVIAIIALFG